MTTKKIILVKETELHSGKFNVYFDNNFVKQLYYEGKTNIPHNVIRDIKGKLKMTDREVNDNILNNSLSVIVKTLVKDHPKKKYITNIIVKKGHFIKEWQFL